MATVAERVDIEPGEDRTVLVVVAHADDVALFLGGTVIRWTDAGWRVVVVRVTDDRWDSVDLSAELTVEAARRELVAAASVLGIDELIDLDYPTDTLGDASEVELREHVIRLIRTLRPHTLVTFDPYGMFGEDNQDHLKVAAAVDEAFWTAQFDKHHPEHLAAGLEPHGVVERWYFARRVMEVTDVVDVSAVIERKVEAVLCHHTAMVNYMHQLILQARTAGLRVPVLENARAGALRPVLEPFVAEGARRVGRRHGLDMAEEFRVVRLGGLAEWFADHGVPLG
ncbi:MAG: PIG-L family deacetylase [Acidimicrobiia bacterium]|nr:PIG-L family deacetylase [Acidimicrobiia bacterium]